MRHAVKVDGPDTGKGVIVTDVDDDVITEVRRALKESPEARIVIEPFGE